MSAFKHFLLLSLVVMAVAHADNWCDIQSVKDSSVLYTYQGLCSQKSFGGDWGDLKITKHVVNATKQAQIDAAKATEDAKATARTARRARLQTFCATLSGGQKDICDQIIDLMDNR